MLLRRNSRLAEGKWINVRPDACVWPGIIAANEPFFNTGVNIMPHMPNAGVAMENAVFANPNWWADNGDAIAERFTAWMATVKKEE